jgi:hypothetical protein
MIGFSADIGRHLGDTKEHCSTFKGSRWSAAAVYIVGFWFLDFANNTVQVTPSSLGSICPAARIYANRSEFYRHELFLFSLNLCHSRDRPAP